MDVHKTIKMYRTKKKGSFFPQNFLTRVNKMVFISSVFQKNAGLDVTAMHKTQK